MIPIQRHPKSSTGAFRRKPDTLPWFAALSGLVMLTGFLFGSIVPSHFADWARSAVEQLQQMAAGTHGSALKTLVTIFFHNLLAACIIMALGVFLGLVPLFEMWFNGLLVGFVANLGAARLGVPEWKILVFGMLPHGVLELPALVWSSAIGLQLGFAAVHSVGYRIRSWWLAADEPAVRMRPIAFRSEVSRLRKHVPLIVSMLFLAACVESIVTPKLIQWGLK